MTRQEKIMELRKSINDGIDNLVRTIEKKVASSGLSMFDIGFTAIEDDRQKKDFSCSWEMVLENLSDKELQAEREPMHRIHETDYAFMKTSRSALGQADSCACIMELQVDALKYLYTTFQDHIWRRLGKEDREEFSQLLIIFDNCIEKIAENVEDIENLHGILTRNRQRIALGMDKKEAA